MNKVDNVSPEEYLENYKEYSEWIKKALEFGSGSHTVLELSQEIINGSHQLWTVRNEQGNLINVTLTEVITWENKKTLHLVTTTGEGWNDYKDAHHTIEEFGKLLECERITFWGRPGWDRIIRSLSGKQGQKYEKQYVVYNMIIGENNATRT